MEKKEEKIIELNEKNKNTVTGSHTDTEVYNPAYIKKKIAYNAFLKALKRNNFTTGYMLSKALGVDPQTINLWCRTPKAIKIMQEDIDKYVNKISSAKDWKASAYLLDKITNTGEEDKSHATNLIGLSIVINPQK